MIYNSRDLEILSPAGDMERFLAAVDFGADAVYLAGKEFGMRAAPSNFDFESLQKAVEYAHSKGVKVYLTCNILPRNNEIETLSLFLENAKACLVDALIISDLGVLSIAKKICPDIDVHISTQAGIVNYAAARFFYDMGAKRVVLSRELSLEEIACIRAKTDKKLEIETFVHGSMCVSFSGRCLLSNYLTGRDANRGDCAQPCRWKYAVMEENREGQYFAIEESKEGTYLFNSRDLCMIEHMGDLVKAGVSSFKIEGRAKSAYYVAVATNAYKHALREYLEYGQDHKVSDWIVKELDKISHRGYSTGFFFKNEPGEVRSNGGYIRKYDVAAVTLGYDHKNKLLKISQRNRFFKGDILDVLEPKGKPFNIKVGSIYNEYLTPVENAPHPMQVLYIPSDINIKTGTFLRKLR